MIVVRFIFTVVFFVVFISGSHAQQTGWHLQNVPIATRWSGKIDPSSTLQEYPRPQMVRKQWQNLNGIWKYEITERNNRPVSYHSEILVPFPIESALSGVQKPLLPNQKLWYTRQFNLDNKSSEMRYLLHFGAVDWQAEVFINNKKAGDHTGGYQEFSLDITPMVKKGQNQIVVSVYDPTDQGDNPRGKQVLRPQGIMYTASSGIWQTVWLEIVPKVAISSIDMIPDIEGRRLSLKVSANTGDTNAYSVSARINQAKLPSSASGILAKDFFVPVKDMHLWSPEDPFLYDMTVTLFYKGNPVDSIQTYFGMRKVEVKKDDKGFDRIFLNGQPYFNLGVLDQGFWPDGLYTAPTDSALLWDIRAIKAMGFNTIRKHIKIEPARWYYHCDREGVLVWQDMVTPASITEAAKSNFEEGVKETIQQLRNYPSIITWVVFNEGWNVYEQARITAWVKTLDASRIINGHSGENYSRKAPQEQSLRWINSDLTDVHSYPGPELPARHEKKAMVLGEFGGIGVPVDGHQWDDIGAWGYIQLSPDSLLTNYRMLTSKIKDLQSKGLSATIYTEPFDVEKEQNGLITYDRKIIKIPLEVLKKINGEIAGGSANMSTELSLGLAPVDKTSDGQKYAAILSAYKSGTRDSVTLRKLAIMAFKRKDSAVAARVANEYYDVIKDPLTARNIQFFDYVVTNSNDKAFKFLYKNLAVTDNVMGYRVTAEKLMNIIFEEQIRPYMMDSTKQPDWKKIEETTVAKFGELGEEKVWGIRMIYYNSVQNWPEFGKSYLLYFKKYGDRFNSDLFLNNLAWNVFTNISDTSVLKEALVWSKKVIGLEDSMAYLDALDTYANLLYKLGRRDDAIHWEQIALSKQPGNKDIMTNLNKMRSGEPTWE